MYVRQQTSARLVERQLLNYGDSSRNRRFNEAIGDDYQVMYDTFGKPIGGLQQGQQAGKGSDDILRDFMGSGDEKKALGGNRKSVGTSLRFSDQVDEFLNLNEPVGETGVVTVLNQKIIEEDDDYLRKQRENLI